GWVGFFVHTPFSIPASRSASTPAAFCCARTRGAVCMGQPFEIMPKARDPRAVALALASRKRSLQESLRQNLFGWARMRSGAHLAITAGLRSAVSNTALRSTGVIGDYPALVPG